MAREFQFYVVPTPIGNIKDITLRAIETLKEVDFIACEDTRVTQKLLNHYDIRTKCISYHKYNERERVDFFLNELRTGKTIALVSDAGTPMICDPGGVIIQELVKNGFSITSLPGACAVTTFLSSVPRSCEEFAFIGFIPRTEKQIEEALKNYTSINTVFYDSPERILKTIKVIQKVRPEAVFALARELSKLFEEVVTGSADEITQKLQGGIKGEIVCMVYANKNPVITDVDFKIKKLQEKGFKAKEIAVILSTLYNLNKNEIYQKILDM